MASTSDIVIARMPAYRRRIQACIGCSSHQHGVPGTRSCQLKCPAWGPTFSNSRKPNHLPRVCQAKKPGRAVRKGSETNEAAINTLVAHITFKQTMGSYTSEDTNQIKEIDADVVSFSPKPDPRQAKDIPSNHSTKMTIFPKS